MKRDTKYLGSIGTKFEDGRKGEKGYGEGDYEGRGA